MNSKKVSFIEKNNSLIVDMPADYNPGDILFSCLLILCVEFLTYVIAVFINEYLYQNSIVFTICLLLSFPAVLMIIITSLWHDFGLETVRITKQNFSIIFKLLGFKYTKQLNINDINFFYIDTFNSKTTVSGEKNNVLKYVGKIVLSTNKKDYRFGIHLSDEDAYRVQEKIQSFISSFKEIGNGFRDDRVIIKQKSPRRKDHIEITLKKDFDFAAFRDCLLPFFISLLTLIFLLIFAPGDIIANHDIGLLILTIIMLFAFGTIFIFALLDILWILSGKEIIHLNNKYFSIKKELPVLTLSKRFNIYEISLFQYQQNIKRKKIPENTYKLLKYDTGNIIFEHQLKTYRFASGANKVECEEIINLLNNYILDQRSSNKSKKADIKTCNTNNDTDSQALTIEPDNISDENVSLSKYTDRFCLDNTIKYITNPEHEVFKDYYWLGFIFFLFAFLHPVQLSSKLDFAVHVFIIIIAAIVDQTCLLEKQIIIITPEKLEVISRFKLRTHTKVFNLKDISQISENIYSNIDGVSGSRLIINSNNSCLSMKYKGEIYKFGNFLSEDIAKNIINDIKKHQSNTVNE